MNSTIDLLGATVGVVGYVRERAPKIDGWKVLPLTLVVAILCAFALAPDDLVISGAALLALVKVGLRTALMAAGGMHAVSYGARKFGDAISRPTALLESTAEPIQRSRAALVPLAVLAVLALVLLWLPGCSAAQDRAVLDVTNSVCEELPDTDPQWVTFGCTAIGIADGVSHVFKARVRREDAPQLAARRCPEGSVAP